MTPLITPKNHAKSMIDKFFATKLAKDKAKMWDSVVGYINSYPELYYSRFTKPVVTQDDQKTKRGRTKR